jgi:hypothetical protein
MLKDSWVKILRELGRQLVINEEDPIDFLPAFMTQRLGD